MWLRLGLPCAEIVCKSTIEPPAHGMSVMKSPGRRDGGVRVLPCFAYP